MATCRFAEPGRPVPAKRKEFDARWNQWYSPRWDQGLEVPWRDTVVIFIQRQKSLESIICFLCLLIGVCERAHLCYRAGVDGVRRWLAGAGPLHPSCGFLDQSPGHQAWWQVPLPAAEKVTWDLYHPLLPGTPSFPRHNSTLARSCFYWKSFLNLQSWYKNFLSE